MRRHALRVNFNLMVMFRPIRYVDSESFVMEVTYAVTESLHVTEHFAFGTALFFFSVFSVLSSFFEKDEQTLTASSRNRLTDRLFNICRIKRGGPNAMLKARVDAPFQSYGDLWKYI